MRSATRRLGACALLATVWLDRDPRLLTIIGPGGTGKTRFSIERARFLAEDADGGTVFVPLAPVRDAATPSPQMKGILGTDSGDRFGGFSGRFKACRGRDRLAAELLNLRAKALYERESAARCREFKSSMVRRRSIAATVRQSPWIPSLPLMWSIRTHVHLE
jgi:hypothetical protein